MADSLYNTGNAIGSTDAKDLHDNAIVFDMLLNGDETIITDRLGASLKTIKYLQNIFSSLDTGSFTYASTTAGLAATTSGQYFRVPQGADGSVSFIYYLNNSGVATKVAQTLGTSALKDLITKKYDSFDVTNVSPFFLDGYVLNADGTTTANSVFRAYTIPVKKGDSITYTGAYGSLTSGEIISYFLQLDANKALVSTLYTFTSEGSNATQKSVTVNATQDGYIAVRVRKVTDSSSYTFALSKGVFLDYATLRDANYFSSIVAGSDIDYSSDIESYLPGAVMNADGSFYYSAGTDWRLYIVPVKNGDKVTLKGTFGSNTSGESILYIAQLDSSKKYVSSLGVYTSTGSNSVQSSMSGTATQDGYIAVRVRVAISASSTTLTYSVTRQLATALAYKTMLNTSVSFVFDIEDLSQNLDKSDGSISLTSNTARYVEGRVLDANGKATDGLGSVWRTYYIPVRKGWTVNYNGAYGSTKNGEVIPYFFQMDRYQNFVSVLYSYTSTGSSTVVQSVTQTATQDGYIAVRVRNYGTFSVTLGKTVSGSASQEITVSAEMIKVPVNMDNQWDYNGSPYIQDQTHTFKGFQYVAYWGEGGVPIIAKRNELGGAWEYYDLSQVSGNPLKSPVKADGHNVLSMTITNAGYILVSGNYHNNECRCVISNNPQDITSFKAISYSSSNSITYPRFVKYPDGTTQAFWREGQSGAGSLYGAIFDDSTLTFNDETLIIGEATTATSNPYEQRPVVDASGNLHLCWGYRTYYNDVNTNFGMFYAVSSDKGATFKSADGATSFALPLTDVNSEKIFDAPAGSGYVNQNGACIDLNGNYHTVFWQTDTSGFTQIEHVYRSNSAWESEKISDFTFTVPSGSGVPATVLTRPVMASTKYGKTYVFYHTTKMGRESSVRAIDVTTPGAPIDFALIGVNIGTHSMSVNTQEIYDTGVYKQICARGSSGVADANYTIFASEVGYLASCILP